MAVGKGPVGSEKATQQMQQLDARIELLRRKFNMFFNGFDKLPPTQEFETAKREFREFSTQSFASPTMRFKAQNLIAKWNLARTMWERDLQRMEEGQFKPQANHAARTRDLRRVDDIE